MSGPGESIPHTPPMEFPTYHLAGVAIPQEFAREIREAADADGVLFADKLLKWARMGRLCEKSHGPKVGHPRKRK